MDWFKFTLVALICSFVLAKVHFLEIENVDSSKVAGLEIEINFANTEETPSHKHKHNLIPELTQDFQNWLNTNGYGNYSFVRTDVPGGSYGGKNNSNDTITNTPVIFIHGNSDSALGGSMQGFDGWTPSITYFLSQGYKSSELYATTWGPADPDQASNQYHSYVYLAYLRTFIQAVISYTGATKVHIIAHSMGVTLARKAIKGGNILDNNQTYYLGPTIASQIDIFLGIAGANYGLINCLGAFSLPTCGMTDGFYPGYAPGPIGLSKILLDININGGKEGTLVYTMLSTADDFIMYGDMVWGKLTSQIPGEDASKIYNNLTNMGTKDYTVQEQYQVITTRIL